ncbi:MAG: hypothetical protein OXH99_09025 [Bryobacterales bacterium]|nr:hypothetical protein [Bryobacterales bacterium]
MEERPPAAEWPIAIQLVALKKALSWETPLWGMLVREQAAVHAAATCGSDEVLADGSRLADLGEEVAGQRDRAVELAGSAGQGTATRPWR